MDSESPALPDLRADPDPARRSRIDPVRYAVQAALVLYLLPVIVLVATIGGSAIVIGRLARLALSAATIVTGKPGRFACWTVPPDQRVIGSRPILTRKNSKRSRIIR